MSPDRRRLHLRRAWSRFVRLLLLLDSGTWAAVESLTLWRVRSHSVPTHLSERAFTLNHSFEDCPLNADFVTFEIQNDTVFPHEHGTQYGVVPVDVDYIEVVVPYCFTDFKTGKESEIDLRTTANGA
jgi:hypothetical protein